MLQWHDEIEYDFSEPSTDAAFTEQSLFFDIETTGFSPAHSQVYLIGCAVRKGSLLIIDQFFAENASQEAAVLEAFFSYIKPYHTLITFNGIGFDIPFLKGRCAHYHQSDSFSSFTYLDLFKTVSHMKALLQLPNYKQKSIEAFLGIAREDAFSGGDLIDVYRSYTVSPSPEECYLLKLHNYEDVLGMPKLLPILSYQKFFEGNFSILSLEANEYKGYDGSVGNKELLFTLECSYPLPSRLSCQAGEYYLTLSKNKAILRIRLTEDTLKIFLPNFKDYYYLPEEDCAIPKVVASSVEKAHRKNATAATCYNNKYGIFLPQYEELFSPVLRQKYKEKKSYFELTSEFVTSNAQQRKYILHVLQVISEPKRYIK